MKSSLHPLQIAAWKRMTFAEKWELARAANTMVREAVRRRLQRETPELSPTELDRRVANYFRHECGV